MNEDEYIIISTIITLLLVKLLSSVSLHGSVSGGHDQLVRSRHNVHLLRTVDSRTSHAEVPLVEEVLNLLPAGRPTKVYLQIILMYCIKYHIGY